MTSYLKETLEEFEFIFFPNQYPKYFEELPSSVRRNPNKYFNESFFKNGIVWFPIGGGETDTLTFMDFTGVSLNSSPNRMTIDYKSIVNEVGHDDFLRRIRSYTDCDAHNYIEFVSLKLNDLPTNVRADRFFHENLEGLKNSIDAVDFLLQDESLGQDQIELLQVYQKSFRNSFLIFRERFGLTYSKLFDNYTTTPDTKDANISKESGQSSNGLILGIKKNDNIKYRLTPNIAARLTKNLKKHGFIRTDTKAASVFNLFQKEKAPLIYQVIWTGQNHHLKYFINQLYEKGLIRESRYQFKWKDVANCFVNSNGDLYGPQSFSKNAEKPKDKIKKKIDSIVDQFYWDLNKNPSY